MVRGAAALVLAGGACLPAPTAASPPSEIDAAPEPIPDAGFDECSGLPVSALVDDFDDPLLSNWRVFTSDELTCRFAWFDDDVAVVNESETEHCGMRSKLGYDLTGEATWLTLENDATPTGDPKIEFRAYVEETRYVVIELEPDNLRAGRCLPEGCALASAVSPNQLVYWRVRHDATRGLVIAEASNNNMNWTALAEVVESDVSCVHLEVASYANPAGENAPAVIDAVNLE